jgi:hypothetical protein
MRKGECNETNPGFSIADGASCASVRHANHAVEMRGALQAGGVYGRVTAPCTHPAHAQREYLRIRNYDFSWEAVHGLGLLILVQPQINRAWDEYDC